MNIRQNKTGTVLFVTGYITVITTTLLFIIKEWSILPYIFSAGAILTITGRYMTLPLPENFRIRRLNNLLAIGAVLLLTTAYFLFKGNNVWALTLTLSAFIDLFTSFRYPKKQ